MKRALGAIAVLVAFAGTAGAARADLSLVSSTRLDSRLSELTFHTNALAADTKVRVLVPAGYRPGSGPRYPVLYLLHGSFDSYTAWTVEGNVEQLTAGLPLIVVMPDGGQVGNYVDWYNDGKFGLPEWSTYHIDQLLPWIDAHYRTRGTRAGRAIGGLSMGGGGAMKYAAAHPDLFAAALSFSGGVSIDDPLEVPVTEAGGVADGDHSPGAIYGLHSTEEVRWRDNDTVDLAENLRGLKLWFYTGNGLPGGPNGNLYDPTEAEVHTQNLEVHRALLSLGIPHVFDDYGPGGHQWYYWQRDLRQSLPGLMRVFARPPAPPSPFTFTRADPYYCVYGWCVTIKRPAMEFSELADAGKGGFSLQGSGTGIVRTAAMFRPRAMIKVRLATYDGTSVHSQRADRHGRLTLTVPLGPGNPLQQYTPQAQAFARARSHPPGTSVVGGSVVYTTRVVLRTAKDHTKHRNATPHTKHAH